MFLKKSVYFIERNHIKIVIKVGMVRSGNDQQFFVVSCQSVVGLLAEVARMGLLAMYQ